MATSNVGRMHTRVDRLDEQGIYPKKTNVYLTPQPLLERVYACLGMVDLDPCSNSVTEPQVKANRYYVEGTNGLLHPWVGRIFCNPPYKTVKLWTRKFLEEYRIQHMDEGILLVAGSLETVWFQDLLQASALMCAIRGRLHFDQAPGVPCREQARFPSVLFYLGYRGTEFRMAFQNVGGILRNVHPYA